MVTSKQYKIKQSTGDGTKRRVGILSSVPAKVKKQKSPFEMRMAYFGLPAALVALTLIWTMRTPAGLSYSGKMAMGIFAFALILWVSNGIPNYVTSLIVIFLLPAAGAWTEKATLGVFGYEVIWLMIAAFVIASGMEKSGLAKRLALFLVTRFGKSVNTVLIVLMVTNFLIAFVVPSTTARAVMLLPIVMMIMEVFEVGNTTPQDRNFGKLMALQGIQANNLSTGAIVTATSSQILAISFIKDLTGTEISWMKWFIASAPVAIITLAASFLIGKMLFKTGNRSASAEKMTALEEEYKGLGKMNGVEVRALIIFLITIFLWATDEYHGAMFGFDISLVVVAIVSAAIFLSLIHILILSFATTKVSFLVFVNILLFVLGMLLDSAVLQLVLLPILCPIAQSFGIDMVHFGVVFTLNTMIGLCTPPFGMLLFIVTGISGEKMNTIIKEVMPMVFVMVLVLILITFVPDVIMWLPRLFGR